MLLRVKLRRELRGLAMKVRMFYLRKVLGYDIGKNCIISFKANIDRTNPMGIHIGDDSGVAFGAVVLSHNFTMNRSEHTRIGSRCLIGAHALVGPGVTIGDGSIVGPGAVVLADIPANCLAVGNPARVIERDICTGRWGVRIDKTPPERIDPRVLPDGVTREKAG